MFSKFISLFLVSLVAFTGAANAAIIGGGPCETKIIHLSYQTNTATKFARNSGRDYASPKGFLDGDLFDIPVNTIVENVYAIVDEPVAGITKVNFGDDDAGSGFIASASGTFASDGLNYWDIDYKGSYLRGLVTFSPGVNNVKPLAKYYSASQSAKEFKSDFTGEATAGKARVFVRLCSPGKSGL